MHRERDREVGRMVGCRGEVVMGCVDIAHVGGVRRARSFRGMGVYWRGRASREKGGNM